MHKNVNEQKKSTLPKKAIKVMNICYVLFLSQVWLSSRDESAMTNVEAIIE